MEQNTTTGTILATDTVGDAVIDTFDRGTVKLGRTTYTVTESVYRDGRYPSSTYLTGPRGALYFLRGFLGEDTGLRQVISMGSGNPLRVQGNEVRVFHFGDHIEVATKPRPIH
jgi:hypothetical protein